MAGPARHSLATGTRAQNEAQAAPFDSQDDQLGAGHATASVRAGTVRRAPGKHGGQRLGDESLVAGLQDPALFRSSVCLTGYVGPEDDHRTKTPGGAGPLSDHRRAPAYL